MCDKRSDCVSNSVAESILESTSIATLTSRVTTYVYEPFLLVTKDSILQRLENFTYV